MGVGIIACLMLALETDGHWRARYLLGAGICMILQIGQWL